MQICTQEGRNELRAPTRASSRSPVTPPGFRLASNVGSRKHLPLEGEGVVRGV